MNNYTVVYSDDFLAHHGILGQKWGKKNGPPYPLDASDHSASEKKAGWRQSLKNADKKKIAKGIAVGVGTAAVVAGAAYYATHKSEVNAFVKTALSELQYSSKYGKIAESKEKIKKGKEYAKDKLKEAAKGAPKKFFDSAVEGINTGIMNTGKAVGIGVTMLALKEGLDIAAGRQKSEKIYKANNKKKIDSFWKSYNDNFNNNRKKNDDEDDD